MVHVSVRAEEIFSLFGFPITNSMILSWIAMGVFLLIGFYYSNTIHKHKKPKVFYVLQSMFLAIYNLVQSVLHERTILFFPLLGAYFFYILINNWMGMVPTVGSLLIKPQIEREVVTQSSGIEPIAAQIKTQLAEVEKQGTANAATHGEKPVKIPLLRANTADLNTTFALALVTVFMIQYYGFKYNGMGYLKKFVNFSSPIMCFVGILELISELARILSFSFRLFGNVLAGEILITIVAFLIPPAASFIMLPFFTLEIMAGAIQALVFMMLSTVLVGMATAKTTH